MKMKTVEEVVAYLRSERDRLDYEGVYGDEVAHLNYLIENITGEPEKEA
jgi:hypothetical protein